MEEFRWRFFDFGGIRNLRMKERTGEILLVVRLSLLGVSCYRTIWRRRPSLDSAKRMTEDDGHQIQSCPCLCLLVYKGRWFGVQLLCPRAASTSLNLDVVVCRKGAGQAAASRRNSGGPTSDKDNEKFRRTDARRRGLFSRARRCVRL